MVLIALDPISHYSSQRSHPVKIYHNCIPPNMCIVMVCQDLICHPQVIGEAKAHLHPVGHNLPSSLMALMRTGLLEKYLLIPLFPHK